LENEVTLEKRVRADIDEIAAPKPRTGSRAGTVDSRNREIIWFRRGAGIGSPPAFPRWRAANSGRVNEARYLDERGKPANRQEKRAPCYPVHGLIVTDGRRFRKLSHRTGYDGRMRRFAVLAMAGLALAAAPQSQPSQTIDVQRSKMTVYVYKQGLFSFLADNHVIDAPIASGSFDAQRRRVEITVDAAKMRVLDPRLPADKRSSVQANMVGPQVLDAARFPTIIFKSTSIDGIGKGTWKVSGDLQLHGQTHPATFQVQSDGAGRFTGSATVRQTEFGITPIKIAGGAVSVKDDVRVEFEILCCVANRI
jgi:polyisoprenoid-binding protein YceI